MWMLMGIAFRIAVSLGLHRDGTLLELPILLTETRRRLWWAIRFLDYSCAEDCGFALTHIQGADTRVPLNINDADITATDTIYPIARSGFTEMTWPLCKVCSCTPKRARH